MEVMATGVHPSRFPRLVGQIRLLLNRQRVHIPAQSDHRPFAPADLGNEARLEPRIQDFDTGFSSSART